MRILILVDCYLPSHKSGAKQIHDLGVEFRRQGHEVTILCAAHEIPQDLEVTVEEGLRVARVKTRQIKGAPKLLRGFYEMKLSTSVWRTARKFLSSTPHDIIVFYSPTIFWGALVKRLKSLWRCPAYLILRDIFPEWAVNVGALRRGLVYQYLSRKEFEQYDSADVIAVQSPGDLKHFARNSGERNYRLEVLYNWTALHIPLSTRTQYRAELGLQNKIVFFYGGNLGIAQDIDNIARLASSLTDHPEIHFLLVGEGSEAGRLKKIVAEKGIQNVQLLPPVGQDRYLSMVSEFDIGLITLDRRLTNHNIPGKLLSYLYWSIPVLASVNPGNDLFDLLGKSGAGFTLANGDDAGLRAAGLRMARDSELRARMGRNGRLLLEEKFSVEAAARQILRHLSEKPESLEESEPVTSLG